MQRFSSRQELLSEVSVVGDSSGVGPASENGIVPLRLASDGKVHLCQFVDVATSTLERFNDDAEVVLKLKCDPVVARVERVLWTADEEEEEEDVATEGGGLPGSSGHSQTPPTSQIITAVLVFGGLSEQSSPLTAADFNNATGVRPVVVAFLETLRFFHSLGLSGFRLSASDFYRCSDASAAAICFCDVAQVLKQLVGGASLEDGTPQESKRGDFLQWPAPETLFESMVEFEEKIAADFVGYQSHGVSSLSPRQESALEVSPPLSEADVALQRRQGQDIWFAGITIVSSILKSSNSSSSSSSNSEAGKPRLFKEGPNSANLSAYLRAVETVPRSFEGSLEFLALPRTVGNVISAMLRVSPLRRSTAAEGLRMLNQNDGAASRSAPRDAGQEETDNSLLQSRNEAAEDESQADAKEPIQETAVKGKESDGPPTSRGKTGCDDCIIS